MICAFVQEPVTEKLINKILLSSKQFPKPEVIINCLMSVTTPKNAIENDFARGLNAPVIRVSHANKYLKNFKNNRASSGCRLRLEVRAFAKKYAQFNEDAYEVVHLESGDGLI